MNSAWDFTLLLLISLVNFGLIEQVHGRLIRESGNRCSDISGCNCGEQCVNLFDMNPCQEVNASDCVCLSGCAVADIFIPAGVTRRNTYCNLCRCQREFGDGIPLCTKLPWCNIPEGVTTYRENPNCVETIRINFPLRQGYNSRSSRSWRLPPFKTRALTGNFLSFTATKSTEKSKPAPLKSRSTGEELEASPEKARAIDWWLTPTSKIRSKNGLNPPFQDISIRNLWHLPIKGTRSMWNTDIPLETTGLNGPYQEPKDVRSLNSFHSNDEVNAAPKQSRQNYEFNESPKRTTAMNWWLHHITNARSNDRFILRPKMARAADWLFPFLTETKSNELYPSSKKTREMDRQFLQLIEPKSYDELSLPPKTTRDSIRLFPLLTESNTMKTRANDWWFPKISEARSNGRITLRPKMARDLIWWFPHITGSSLNELNSSPIETRSHEEEFNPPPKQSREMEYPPPKQSREMEWWNPSKIGVNPPFKGTRAMDWMLQPHQDTRSTENNGPHLQHAASKTQYNPLGVTRSLNWLDHPPKAGRSDSRFYWPH